MNSPLTRMAKDEGLVGSSYALNPITKGFPGFKNPGHRITLALSSVRDTGRADERIRERTRNICKGEA